MVFNQDSFKILTVKDKHFIQFLKDFIIKSNPRVPFSAVLKNHQNFRTHFNDLQEKTNILSNLKGLRL